MNIVFEVNRGNDTHRITVPLSRDPRTLEVREAFEDGKQAVYDYLEKVVR